MNKRDEDEHQIDTVPPPPGEDDAYSAETRIGKIPSDLLQAMKRAHASEAGRPSLPPDLVASLGGDKGAVSSRPSVPASRTVPRPLSVPRVTPTIPPPPETTPAPINEGIPSFGLPNFGPAAGSPAPPKRTDGPAEFTLEGLASDDHDYVGSMLGNGPAAPPPAPAGPPAVQVNQIVSAVPMVAPPGVPSVVVSPPPAISPAPVPAEDVLATPAQSRTTPQPGAGTPLVVPVDPPAADLDLPVPGPMRPLTDSQVEEGRMSFAPFTEQSRRLNIILMVSIGFLLLLTVIVLIAAK